MKKHSKALVIFAVSKQIPIVYSADRRQAEIMLLLYSTGSKKNLYLANPAKGILAVVNCQLLVDSSKWKSIQPKIKVGY